jgi:hypothetical protein
MKMLKLAFLCICVISLAGCLDNNTESKPVTDYGGFTEYYIVNQTGLNLNATFRPAPTHTDQDSAVAVPKDSTTKIFKYGGIGGNFPPSQAFGNLIFYKLADKDMTSPLLTIDPIVNENWKIVDVESKNTIGYELTVTDEDLN